MEQSLDLVEVDLSREVEELQHQLHRAQARIERLEEDRSAAEDRRNEAVNDHHTTDRLLTDLASAVKKEAIELECVAESIRRESLTNVTVRESEWAIAEIARRLRKALKQ